MARAELGRGLLHRNAGADHDKHRDRREDRIARVTTRRMDRRLELELLLHDRASQPARPRRRKPDATEPIAAHAKDHQIRNQHGKHDDETDRRRENPDHDRDAHRGDRQRHDTFQHNHPPVQRDLAGDNSREAQQRRQVEHIRADHHPGAEPRMMPRKRRHRSCDLRRIGRQCGEHPQQRL